MAASGGYEPPECQSQSLMPYHLATRQYIKVVEGHGFEPWNPKEQIYSLPRLTTSLFLQKKWCRLKELNPQPTDYKSVALPIELSRQINKWWAMRDSNSRPPACKADALPNCANRPNTHLPDNYKYNILFVFCQ